MAQVWVAPEERVVSVKIEPSWKPGILALLRETMASFEVSSSFKDSGTEKLSVLSRFTETIKKITMKQVIFNFIILRTTPQYIELYTMVLQQLQTSVRLTQSPYVRYHGKYYRDKPYHLFQ